MLRNNSQPNFKQQHQLDVIETSIHNQLPMGGAYLSMLCHMIGQIQSTLPCQSLGVSPAHHSTLYYLINKERIGNNLTSVSLTGGTSWLYCQLLSLSKSDNTFMHVYFGRKSLNTKRSIFHAIQSSLRVTLRTSVCHHFTRFQDCFAYVQNRSFNAVINRTHNHIQS